MVFDKTGTLTEDGLTILGVRGASGLINKVGSKFTLFYESVRGLLPPKPIEDAPDNILGYIQHKTVLLNEAMACCHSITYINGIIIGDPLDIKMF